MPNSFIINLIDNLTLITLIITAIYLVLRKALTNRPMTFILINVCFSLILYIVAYFYPLQSIENGIISNLTMHIDTLSGLGFFYYLWMDRRYQKFLVVSVIPILVIWLATFAIKKDLAHHSWNLILSSLWFFIAALYALLLLYQKSSYQDTAPYISRFFLITGFLFYNFVYLVIETCYLFFTSISNITDAWNINYWAYFIFRLMMLAGVVAWYGRSYENHSVLANVKK